MRTTFRSWISGTHTMAAKALGFVLVLSALSGPAWADDVPEMDPGLATSAMALLGAGMLLIARHRRAK
jgi:hypothetical protein